uniref:Uncharacterized protein n=1 Tax=Ditylenchus dipsaci TaxID=166011 RepID=A0A915ENG7_9BILA
MLLILVVLNLMFWPTYMLGCGKLRRWRQKKKGSKQKTSSKKQQPSLIPVTPHPQQLKTPEDVKPDQTPMRAATGTPGTASVRVAEQQLKKSSVVLPLRPPGDQASQGQQDDAGTNGADKSPEVVQPMPSSAPQPQQQTARENSQENKENGQKEEENKNVEKKAVVKRVPTKDARAEIRKRSVPCKTGKEADKLLDTSVQRMSPENTLRDVPRTMPEYSVNYEKADMDPTLQDAQLL